MRRLGVGCVVLAAFALSELGVPLAGATGAKWHALAPAVAPSARYAPAMAYDPDIGKVVIFGGLSNDPHTLYGDTWTWDGSTWEQLSPAASPPARADASLAYDPATSQLVLFGGVDTTYLSETWTFDGSTWTKHTTPPPAANCSGPIAWDAATNQLLLFAGQGGTWSWDGDAWTRLLPTTSPNAQCGTSLAYDDATDQLVLFGGFGEIGHHQERVYDTTYTWDGTNWTKHPIHKHPSSRGNAAMAYDSATGQLVLFGGVNPFGDLDLGDTWAWNGATWAKLRSHKSPIGRSSAGLAYLSSSGELVLFGGYNYATSSSLADTWVYN
jgi:N-acetylneuraminic acid mutarotase